MIAQILVVCGIIVFAIEARAEALGQKAVNDLSRQTDTPQDDLLAQLSKYPRSVVDKLTPNGRLPNPADLRSDYRRN
jgi:uncharacterized protein YidB (DUF937 family)